jgi:hemerythrin-like domain-containing protein
MIDLKQLSKQDPVKRNVDKGLEQVENSPMDPPDAYAEPSIEGVPYEEMPALIKLFMDEHKAAMDQINDFEKALVQFKTNGYKLEPKINEIFGNFFRFFDDHLLEHNQKEEKNFFPLLNKKLIESGEHSNGPVPKTAIDIMEDDHVKFIQLGALTFNFLGLASRLKDDVSRTFVYDVSYENGRELIELLKLHIYREDHTLFPLAVKLISKEEFEKLASGVI